MLVFQVTAKSANILGRYSGGSIVASKLIAKEKSLEYETLDGVKQAVIIEEVSRRSLAALAFTGLNNNNHKELFLNTGVRHSAVHHNNDQSNQLARFGNKAMNAS